MTGERVRTMLGFPDPLPDEQRVSTGIEDLDRRLLKWLDLHEGTRAARREGDRCVLVDCGVEVRETTSSSYEDSVRKVLQMGIDADYAESRTGIPSSEFLAGRA